MFRVGTAGTVEIGGNERPLCCPESWSGQFRISKEINGSEECEGLRQEREERIDLMAQEGKEGTWLYLMHRKDNTAENYIVNTRWLLLHGFMS